MSNRPADMTVIAIEHANGMVSRMQCVVRAGQERFDPAAAAANGFVLVDNDWVRTMTPALVEAEIRRTQFDPRADAVVGWAIVPPDAFPPAEQDEVFKAARRWNAAMNRVEIDLDRAKAMVKRTGQDREVMEASTVAQLLSVIKLRELKAVT